jgi:signal transduction histidine kinase
MVLLLAILAKDQNPALESLIPRKILILLYATNTILLLIYALPLIGLVKAVSFFTLYNALAYSLFSGVTMLTMLQVRIRRHERLRMQSQAQLALSEHQVIHEKKLREEQGQLLAMLTHELKTPLSIVRMVLGSKSHTPELIAYADRAVKDMNNVIERCLQAEKFADQATTINKSDFQLIDELEELRDNSPAPARVVIHSDISPVIKSDSQGLRIILANLIDNASKYSPPDSNIDIKVAKDNNNSEQGVSIMVQNLPGRAGWPDSDKVFQKYYRNKLAHEQIGSGLGLYLVKNLAHLLGGDVCYIPDQNHIQFKLWLPA